MELENIVVKDTILKAIHNGKVQAKDKENVVKDTILKAIHNCRRFDPR